LTVRGLYKKLTHALRYMLLRRLPTCRQTVSVISHSMERPLSPRERVKTKLHLWVCIWCVRYLEQLQLMRDTLRARGAKLPDDDTSNASLSAEARERMKRALSQHSH
jgi:hypothetical protein